MRVIKSIVQEADFVKYIHASYANLKTAEAPSLTDSWAWNSAYKAAHISDTKTDALKASFEMILGFFKAGDTIELSAEVMNISGRKATLTLEQSTALSFNSPVSIFRAPTTMAGHFEMITAKAIAPTDGYYKASFGTYTTETTEFYIRNCVVKAESIIIESGNDPSLVLIENKKWFSARRDAVLPVPNVTTVQMTFETPFNMNGSDFASIDAATGRIKFLKSGVYEIFAYLDFGYNAVGSRYIEMSHIADSRLAIGDLPTNINVSALHEAQAGSLLPFGVRQSSGAEIGVKGNIRIRKVADI